MTAAAPARALPAALAGSAAEAAVRALPARPVVHDLYDPVGAAVYHDFTLADTFEVSDVLREVRRTEGPVLELAAGAGRLTLPLLGLRRPVTAVDLSPRMLALLRERLAGLPPTAARRCTPVCADIAAYRAAEPVDAAVLGTTSVSLLTDAQRRAMLRRTRDNLAPGGSFVLTTAQPADPGGGPPEQVLDVPGASGTVHRVHDLIEPDGRVRHTVVVTPGPEGGTVCHSAVRVVPVPDLSADLAAAGFRVRTTRTLPGGRYTSVLVHAVREA